MYALLDHRFYLWHNIYTYHFQCNRTAMGTVLAIQCEDHHVYSYPTLTKIRIGTWLFTVLLTILFLSFAGALVCKLSLIHQAPKLSCFAPSFVETEGEIRTLNSVTCGSFPLVHLLKRQDCLLTSPESKRTTTAVLVKLS